MFYLAPGSLFAMTVFILLSLYYMSHFVPEERTVLDIIKL